MFVKSDRFGNLEIASEDVISFPYGVVGFPNDDAFVLIQPKTESRVAWLQSTRSPALALPVVSLHMTAIDAPLDLIAQTIVDLQFADDVDDCAVLLVVTAPAGMRPTVNLLAPIIVNSATRTGAQVFLDIDSRSLETPLCLRPEGEPTIINDETTTTNSTTNGSGATATNGTHANAGAAMYHSAE